MKKIIFALSGIFSLVVSFGQSNGFKIRGVVQGTGTLSEAYLSYVVGNKPVVDSVQVKNGEFEFKGILENAPVSASLLIRHTESPDTAYFYLRDCLLFYVENTQIRLVATDSVKNAVITGSRVNAEDQLIRSKIKPVRDRINRYVKIYSHTAPGSKDPGFLRAKDSCRILIDEEKKIYNGFINAHRDSYIALEAFRNINLNYSFDPFAADTSFLKFSPALKGSKLGVEIKHKIDVAKKRQPGRAVMDFKQYDPDGNAVKLSDFKGKYVLVDFWASWCSPCRAENPNLVAAYKKLEDKNFQIISISLDEYKASWLSAVRHDSLPWVQVSDLKGWKNEVAQQYGIDAIPQNILISPEGIILATNLRGTDLYRQLSSYIQ